MKFSIYVTEYGQVHFVVCVCECVCMQICSEE